ncbi:MAG: transglycosylase SLT domain-containing protein [Deltaproteobacteria bacterium]|nr:transglycosylase SLT domain-containing protein [Deltaproteobacteria bacterium]
MRSPATFFLGIALLSLSPNRSEDPEALGKPALPRPAAHDAGAADAGADTGLADGGAGAADTGADEVSIPRFVTENVILIGDHEVFPDLNLKYTPLDEKLRLGIEKLREEAVEEAVRLLDDYLAARPNSPFEPEARLALGVALLMTGDGDAAYNVLTKGDGPRWLEDYRQYFIAEAAFRNGRHDEALRMYQEITFRFPGSSLVKTAEMRAADALYAAGNTREAFAAYKAYAHGARPHEHLEIIHFNMARCALENGEWEQASKYALKLWSKHPESALAGPNLEILAEARRHDRKLGAPTFKQRYTRAVKLAKHHSLLDRAVEEMSALYDAIPDKKANRAFIEKVYFKLGTLFVLQKETESGREVFTNIYENEVFSVSSRAKALMELASIEKRADNNRKAIDLYLEFVEKFKKHADADNALYMAGWLRHSMKEYDEATKILERQIREYPKSDVRDEALWFLAWTHFKSGRTKKATALLKTLVKDVPDSQAAPRAAYFAAKFALKTKQDDSAREGFEKVIAEYPLTYYSFLAQHKLKELWDLDAEMPDAARPDTRLATDDSRPAGPDAGPADSRLTTHDSDLDDGDTPVAIADGNGTPVLDRFVAASRDTLTVNKAAALLRLGLSEAAAGELQRLKENAGSDPEGHFAAATVHALTGDYYRAIVTLRAIFVSTMLRRPSSAELKFWKRMFPLAFKPHVEASSAANKLDPLLILAVMREESNFRPKVNSPVGARGLMQIMPRTGKLIAVRKNVQEFDVDDLYRPSVNTLFGGWYLRELVVKFNGQLPLAVSGYNAGPGAVERWLRNMGNLDLDEFVEEIPYKETRNYCKRVLQTYGIYRYIYLREKTPLPLFTRLNQKFNNNIDF